MKFPHATKGQCPCGHFTEIHFKKPTFFGQRVVKFSCEGCGSRIMDVIVLDRGEEGRVLHECSVIEPSEKLVEIMGENAGSTIPLSN